MGTRVGTRGENGFKMQIFGSDFRKTFPVENNEKRPKCVKIKHLGRFTMAEKEGFEPSFFCENRRRYVLYFFACALRVN